MLDLAEQTGSGIVIVVWSFLPNQLNSSILYAVDYSRPAWPLQR